MAIPPILFPQGVAAGMMQQPAQQPMAQAQQPSPLEALNRALTGDLSASLTGGDRLLALAALMRSATRSGQRAGLTPQQVIGDLRQQQVQQAQARLQMEQLRAAEQRARERQQSVAQYVQTLPEEQRTNFLSLPENMQDEIIAQQYAASSPTISDLARRISEATGFEVGSPQHQALMQQALSRPEMIGLPGGGVGTIPGMSFAPQAVSPAQSPSVVSAQDFMRIVASRPDPQAAVDWAMQNNIVVQPATPEEAARLPSGTNIMLPDGTMGRVP